MHKIFLFFSIIFSFTNLVSCSDEQPKWLVLEEQAIKDIEALTNDAHQSYLQCYALDYQSKKECLELLNNQYIKVKYKSDIGYTKSFQYKAEKLGFFKVSERP